MIWEFETLACKQLWAWGFSLWTWALAPLVTQGVEVLGTVQIRLPEVQELLDMKSEMPAILSQVSSFQPEMPKLYPRGSTHSATMEFELRNHRWYP